MRASVVALLLAPLSSLGGFGFTLHVHVPLDHAARAHGRHYMMGMSEPIPPSADSCSLPQWPTPEMQPVDVVRAQLYAMQEGNAQRFWRFVSPEGKRDTGRTIRARYPYIRPPLYSEMPTYAPLVHCRDFEMLSAVRIGVTGAMQKPTYQVRARVWPALAHGERECGGGSITPAPIFYIFRLTLQPKERPVCYEDDPMQAGISTSRRSPVVGNRQGRPGRAPRRRRSRRRAAGWRWRRRRAAASATRSDPPSRAELGLGVIALTPVGPTPTGHSKLIHYFIKIRRRCSSVVPCMCRASSRLAPSGAPELRSTSTLSVHTLVEPGLTSDAISWRCAELERVPVIVRLRKRAPLPAASLCQATLSLPRPLLDPCRTQTHAPWACTSARTYWHAPPAHHTNTRAHMRVDLSIHMHRPRDMHMPGITTAARRMAP